MLHKDLLFIFLGYNAGDYKQNVPFLFLKNRLEGKAIPFFYGSEIQ
jgi:hypothetical protein